MAYWGKVREYKKDGRVLAFTDRADLNKKDYLLFWKIFKKIFKKDIRASFFQRLVVILEPLAAEGEEIRTQKKGSVEIKEVFEGRSIIHIYPKVILEGYSGHSRTKLKAMIYETGLHELTHLWHDYEINVIKKVAATFQKMRKSLEKIAIEPIEKYKDLSYFRVVLQLFFRKIVLEGLAELGDRIGKRQFPFENDQFAIIFAEAKKNTKEVQFLWRAYLESMAFQTNNANVEAVTDELEKAMNLSSYRIGLHLVYSILFLDYDMNLIKVARTEPFALIKQYEKAMLKHGYRPLISATSGAGILDYKRMVTEWWAVAKSVLKNGTKKS